ncbi:general transcription factor IIF subunit 1 [Drosophila albomicans]|uniref:Transcription initiation factor IIF subunit alpha n=1 Tax=Drosophila albomicans TaxID=7291 RepID=A0A6P8XX83_DROAB|nr:general transcription factor IIF subunit 1 [Drosophila albomicans]
MSSATKSTSSNSGNNGSTTSSTASQSATAGSAASAAAASSSSSASVQEFKIRVPKMRKKHHVMRFNATLNVDFAQWRNVKLERENNMKEFRGIDEDQPKFGAGSEYNRDQREEARRKKFGIIARKYRPDAQPWILKVGGKTGKKFKGIREGGVGENAAFYVFTHAPDGAIEAYPLNEWYNFQPIQRYKSLSAEEAEQEFGRRKKVMNYFSLMLRKRLRGDEEEEQDPEEVKLLKAATKKSKELKITDMDEWIDSEDESDSEDEEEKKKKEQEDSDDGGAGKKGKGKGKKGADKKKKKRDVDDEAFEESDDGDEEGREMDYDTSSSEDEPDPESKMVKDMKGVAEEDALRKLLTSDEEEDEEKKSDESDKEEGDEKKKKEKNKDEASKDKKKKKHSKDDKKASKATGSDSSTDLSSDSTDSEDDLSNGPIKKKPNKDKEKESSAHKAIASGSQTNKSRSATPTLSNDANKRKMMNSLPSDLTGSDTSNSPNSTPAKRPKSELSNSLPSSFAGVVSNKVEDYGITEEAVRRYLKRKPLTATELLTKFKNKKTGVSSDRLVETMTKILKKINPVKHTIQGKMYLWINSS